MCYRLVSVCLHHLHADSIRCNWSQAAMCCIPWIAVFKVISDTCLEAVMVTDLNKIFSGWEMCQLFGTSCKPEKFLLKV
jgi:hypothetical protein